MRQTSQSTVTFLNDIGRSRPKLGCVLMASGLGVRFGGNKLLAPFHGQPLIKQILTSTDTDLFSKRVVVTRHPEIVDLCRQANIVTILHEQPYRSDTVRIGLETLETEHLDGCMFCPCDQPLLTKKSIETMVCAFLSQPDYIYRLSYDGTPGSPILFPRSYFHELKTLPAGKGGSYVTKKYPDRVLTVTANSEWELKDIDTKDDLEKLEGIKNL